MEIIVEDLSSYILDAVKKHPQALAIVREACRARPDGYYFMRKYKSGHWDGYISLMDSMVKFPTGLLDYVCGWLDRKGYEYTITYNTTHIDHVEVMQNDLHGVVLRDYQIEAANVLLDRKRGIAKMATNAGKTEVMAAIIKALGIPKTVVLVHRKELMYQTAERFKERLGLESVGIMGDGKWEPDQVVVGMIQTLHSKIKKRIDVTQLIMVDECHHASSNTILDVIGKLAGSYRYGFSGTPLKYSDLPDMKLIGATGDVVVEVTNEYLIKHGYSAKPIIYIHVIEDSDADNWNMDYHNAYTSLVVSNDERNKIISDIAKDSNGVVLILVKQIEHGRVIQTMIPGSMFVHGGDDIEKRKSVITEMRNNGNGVYIASPIFDEGVDIPSIDTVILAAGGKSNIKLLQRIGRGLRKKSDGGILKVHDFLDDTNQYLLEHSEIRIDTYGKEKFNTIVIE